MPNINEFLTEQKEKAVEKMHDGMNWLADKAKSPLAVSILTLTIAAPAYTGLAIEFSNALSKEPNANQVSGLKAAKTAYLAEFQLIAGVGGYFKDLAADDQATVLTTIHDKKSSAAPASTTTATPASPVTSPVKQPASSPVKIKPFPSPSQP